MEIFGEVGNHFLVWSGDVYPAVALVRDFLKTHKTKLGEIFLQAFDDFRFRHRAHELVHHLPALEDLEVGNGEDVVARRQIRLIINVQFAHSQLAFVLLGDFRKRRGNRVARPAPLGPEIHQDGQFALQDLGVKIIFVECGFHPVRNPYT